MAIHKTQTEHTLSTPLPPNGQHGPHIASVVEAPHTQSLDAGDNPQLALDSAVDTPKHDNSSNFSVDPLAASSFGLDIPCHLVIDVNKQAAPRLPESLQSQQVPGQPNSAFDLEAQTTALPQRNMTGLSESLNKFYTRNTGLFKLLGSVLVFSGVAFTLWQALESRQH